MPFPAFNIDGVIPPFLGQDPGGPRQQMTPHEASAFEVAATLGGSPRRRDILLGWLNHRGALRAQGITTGFQWLDGSFVEDKEPNDMDVVTFFRRPAAASTGVLIGRLFASDPAIFSRALIKTTHHIDALFVDLDATPEAVVDTTRYYLGLFSHRRVDLLWKGMLKVSLEDAGEDEVARNFLTVAADHLVGETAGQDAT